MGFLSIGGLEEDFWALTPRRYRLHMRAHERRQKLEMEARKELGWITAMLTRTDRFPKYEKWMDTAAMPKVSMSAEEVQDRLRAMTSKMPKRSWAEWLQR